MAVAGRILMLPSGVWKSGSNYTFLDVVTHSGSSYVAKNNINNSTKAPPSDTTNWQLIATGYPGNAAGVSAKDTQGMVVTSGSNSTVQALIDAIADKVMTKLLAKTDIVQTESTATNKVPSSAYLKQVKADINSNLVSKLGTGSFAFTRCQKMIIFVNENLQGITLEFIFNEEWSRLLTFSNDGIIYASRDRKTGTDSVIWTK